ncbi:MAG: YncE family protein, partial [Bryobacterales bacterium]|nr:YncE family protein [Bryobacterales bacterium]
MKQRPSPDSFKIPTRSIAGFLAAAAVWAQPYLHPPSVDTYATHDPAGTTILPSGRYLRPEGKHFPLVRFPHGLAMSRDGKRLFVPSDGVGQILTDWQSGAPNIVELHPPKPPAKKKGHLNAGGADFSPDGALLYWSSGDSGTLFVFDTASTRLLAEIPLNVELAGKHFEDSYAADLKVSADGRYLYAADVTNFRLVIVDTQQRRVAGSTPAGRYPYSLAVSGNRVFVANIGLFEYSAVPPPAGGTHDPRGLTRPPYGYPSEAARKGVTFEGRRIPGLGDDNGPQSFSVTGVDVSNPQAPKVLSHWKTGLLIRSPSDNGATVGGSAPNYLAVSGDSLFVSNGNNDLIERIDLSNGKLLAKQRIVPSPLVSRLRGVGPSGMVVSPDGARLYVAESGINAIGVLDARTLQVLGHIPAAWYPYRVAVSPDGRHMACISFKGFGNGPNAGREIPKSDFLGMRGVISIMDNPSDGELPKMTGRVLENNGMMDREADRAAMSSPVIPGIPGRASREI